MSPSKLFFSQFKFCGMSLIMTLTKGLDFPEICKIISDRRNDLMVQTMQCLNEINSRRLFHFSGCRHAMGCKR
jgi:hypothetical protein